MKFLCHLVSLIEGSSDLDGLPEDVYNEIQKNLRDGAKDQDHQWANALDLTHKAYDIAGVQRPTPDMKNAWTQYEENLQYAVAQLAKYRGMDGDWRMSSAIFREAMEKKIKFSVVELGDKSSKSYTVLAKNIAEVIDEIERLGKSQYDVSVKQSTNPENPYSAILSFAKWGIRKNYRIKIQQL